jgi:AcrR family transcriptional regulator
MIGSMSQVTQQSESASPRREQARELLLLAAEDQLREEELDVFTVDKVVERAGVSVGAFYRRFSGKQDLLNTVHDRLHNRMQPAIIEALKAEEHVVQSLGEASDHAFGVMIDHTLKEYRLCRAFMMLAALDPDMWQKFRQINLERRDAVLAVLSKHQSEITHPDSVWAMHQAFHMYLSTMHGRLVFFGPGMRPIHGVSDKVLFAQLLLSIRSFLSGTNCGDTLKADEQAPAEYVLRDGRHRSFDT